MIDMKPTHCCVCTKSIEEDQIDKAMPYLSLDLRSLAYPTSQVSGLLAFHISCFESVSGEFYSDSIFSQMQEAEKKIKRGL